MFAKELFWGGSFYFILFFDLPSDHLFYGSLFFYFVKFSY